jgi:hypothetical protein
MTTTEPIASATGRGRNPSQHRIIPLVTVLCAIYVVSMFLHGSAAVFASDLAKELDIQPARLGFC